MINSKPMPDLIKFLAGQWVVGAGISTLFAAFILLTDAWGVGTLIRSDASPILSAAIFVGVGIALLAPLVVGTAIFLAGSSSDAPD